MFSGIITDIGTIAARDDSAGDTRLSITTAYDVAGITLGESIACNGCCLTVVALGDKRFDVQLSAETLHCTAPYWQVGAKLNLERALKMGDDISGHLVAGHVDGVAIIKQMEKNLPTPLAGGEERAAPSQGGGVSHTLRLEIPTELMKFIAPKGSVALNGVSLTVNQVEGNQCTVNIIPHSWEHTNFAVLQLGDKVNIEVDMLARYVARMTGLNA